MVDKMRIASLLFIILFLCQVTSGCISPLRPELEEKPVIILSNSRGERVSEFAVLDSVFGSFSHLLPDTRYEIQVVRSDGHEISYSSFTSNKRGVIPTTVLWWEVGVTYAGKSRAGKLDVKTLSQYTYSCQLIHKKKKIADIPIRIRDAGPFIYSSDDKGNPLNGFVHGKQNVYLTGRNFPPGSQLHIYVARDRYSWEVGDRFDTNLREISVQLDQRQRDFTKLIWDSGRTTIGSYDIIVRDEARDGVLRESDLIDSIYGVGFTIFRLKPFPLPLPPSHIEADLACQAPPQDPSTGMVIGAPNPIYKDSFAPVEEVWVAVNPHAGGVDHSGNNARLYVVYHKMEADWLDGTPLQDVSSDGYETTVIQPGCANVNYTKVWTNPTVREDGYDVVVDFEPFGVYNKGTDIIDKLDAKGFIVPILWVCLESISFNHDSASSTNDAINIRKNYTQDVVVPEWKKAKKSHPAAYITNRNISVKAVFSAAAGVSSAQIRAAVGSGSLGSINPTTVSFSGGTSGPVTLQVVVSTPNEIKYFYQKWKWYCKDINGSGSAEAHLGDSQNMIFIVLAEPQSPWTTTGQTKPWADALLKSCWWANGKGTLVGAAEKVTQHLFTGVGGKYDVNGGAPHYPIGGSGFDMTSFLGNMPSVSTVNCYDMGKAVVSFGNLVGCGLLYRYSNPFGYLNCILPIGCGWTNNPFNPSNPIAPKDELRSSFGNHAFGSISDNIFDACLKVDTDATPDYGPPFTETWMINEPWNTYKIKVVDNNPTYPWGPTGYPATYSFNVF
jgi:hypothetical protein